MAFTRDFDNALPVDHTLNSEWPAWRRKIMVDLGDRISAIISGFVSGETAKGILALPFIAVTKPATITDQIQLYGKVVSTKTELHAVDEDGNEIQITSAGALNIPGAAAMLALVGPLMMPVGTIYTNKTDSTNPGTKFGFGTWVAIEGEVVVGYKNGDSNFGTPGAAVGAATVTLTKDQLIAGVMAGSTNEIVGTGGSAIGFGSPITCTAGAHNNIQPSRVCYVWERTV